ncbi:hypothetical protein TEA_015061 [Camellia sinensis var. sinensis]|uniref:Uncharacterized protein n=1 Tax=Camellia sinensis var. sinensis TaxID=542762 RepID=A0A4S4D307_CAMSN|nr:hypothetical protein TEA_015061 [Camellia sinensis var. sinensis]
MEKRLVPYYLNGQTWYGFISLEFASQGRLQGVLKFCGEGGYGKAPDESPISADDVFQNGQIKPIYPWFDRSILLAGDSVDLPCRPPVKNVFIEPPPPQAPAKGDLESSYCEWSGKAVEASPEICKKCNSTGFSKLWRFRDLLNRSNSDGRDTFVFLNGSATSPEKKSAAGDAKANGAGAKVKGKKNKTASLSPHELHYVRNRAVREEDRRRSYLPYRPELVGFFTNVRGDEEEIHNPMGLEWALGSVCFQR